MEIVRKHKILNREPIKFDKEIYLNWFNEIIIRFNKESDLSREIVFNYSEIRSKLKIRDKSKFEEFLKDFSDKSSGIFEVPKEKGVKIVGSIFSFRIDENLGTVGVMVNGYFQKFIFSKLDIDTMKKFKKGSLDKVTEEERQFHELNKSKYKELFLEDINIIKSIKGKYNKRIYQLIIQFKETNLFWMKWEEFKKVLEIPDSYNTGSIDTKILNKAKKEIKKTDIEIIGIEKIKKGRKIERIEIKFKTKNKKKLGVPKEKIGEVNEVNRIKDELTRQKMEVMKTLREIGVVKKDPTLQSKIFMCQTMLELEDIKKNYLKK